METWDTEEAALAGDAGQRKIFAESCFALKADYER